MLVGTMGVGVRVGVAVLVGTIGVGVRVGVAVLVGTIGVGVRVGVAVLVGTMGVGVRVGVGVPWRGTSAAAVVRGLAQLVACADPVTTTLALGFESSEVIDAPASDESTIPPTTAATSTAIPTSFPTTCSNSDKHGSGRQSDRLSRGFGRPCRRRTRACSWSRRRPSACLG